MREPASDSPARHVRTDASPARIDRLWGGVSARLAQPRARRARLAWAGAGAALAIAAALAMMIGREREGARGPAAAGPPVVAGGARLETAGEPLDVSLRDGSAVALAPRSALEIGAASEHAVRLELRGGRVRCDVTHRADRSFVVTADDVEVRVVGTRFTVSSSGGGAAARVDVAVERGVVEIRDRARAGEPIRVEAGQNWSRPATPTAPPPVPAPAVAPLREAPPTPPPLPRLAAPAVTARAVDARALFEQARSAWRAGHIEEAARAYQTLVSDYPRDPRAGLAAFELGRLRMDRLGDLPGAVAALERAIALDAGAGFREDAMARLASATAGAHDQAACRRARDRYLEAYPAGVHRRAVEAACGAP